MPSFKRLHFTPVQHKHFEHAFNLHTYTAGEAYQTGFENHLDSVGDPEYATSDDFIAREREIHARMRYFDNLAYTYRQHLGDVDDWHEDHSNFIEAARYIESGYKPRRHYVLND